MLNKNIARAFMCTWFQLDAAVIAVVLGKVVDEERQSGTSSAHGCVQVEAVVKKASQEYKARLYSSGLEGSASEGLGFGIEPFRIYR